MSLCHGLFSGLCAVSNLARLHQEGRCVDARVRAEGAAVATVGADWDLVSSSCRPPTVLSLHPHFTAQGAKGEGEVDAEPDAGVLEAPEWGEQEEEEGVEAEARGGGEGSLWGKPPHLHTHMVTSETPKLEYAQHAFDIRRSRPLQSGPLAQPLPLPAHEVGDGLAGGGGGGGRGATGAHRNRVEQGQAHTRRRWAQSHATAALCAQNRRGERGMVCMGMARGADSAAAF
jgi:hypothetical protein